MTSNAYKLENMGGGMTRHARYINADVAVVIYEAAIWQMDDFGADGYVAAIETHDNGEHEYSKARHFQTFEAAVSYADTLVSA